MQRWAFYLAFGSVASIVVSIAVSQILLGAAIVLLLLARDRLQFPPFKFPLACLMIWTLLSALHSGHFIQGLPQIRKFFVFATALVVCSCFRGTRDCARLLAAWVLLASISACVGFYQLYVRYRQARAEGAAYYEYFLDARLHGLAGHWMTFGGELMIVSVLLVAYVLRGRNRAWQLAGVPCLVLLWTALALGLTRAVFLIGLPLGAAYLFSTWRSWSLAALPAVMLVAALLLPFQVRERVLSVVRPHGTDDSNSRRMIMLRTGLEMVRAHPFMGVGPEQVGRQFMDYVPSSIPRPLPKGWYGHLHNVFLQYAAERGIPALAMLLWILSVVIRDFTFEVRRSTGPALWILHGAIGVTIAVIAEGFFEHNLGDSEVLTMFLTVVSCGYVAIRDREPPASISVCRLQTGTEGQRKIFARRTVG